MSTPGLKFNTQAVVVSQSGQTSENYLRGTTMADGSAVDFSSGWSFQCWVQSKQGFGSNSRKSVDSLISFVGYANGVIDLIDKGGIAAATWWQSATFVVIGTNDAGFSNTVCYQGAITFSF